MKALSPELPDCIESLLKRRMHTADIRRVVDWASGAEEHRQALWALTYSPDGLTGANALWCITHLRPVAPLWLQSKQNELIDRVLSESGVSKKRMFLQLLREQEYDSDSLRVDFLDFCLSKINSECEPYAIRCFSLYIAHKMCRRFPELMAELQLKLDMLACQPLSPGLRCALRKCSR